MDEEKIIQEKTPLDSGIPPAPQEAEPEKAAPPETEPPCSATGDAATDNPPPCDEAPPAEAAPKPPATTESSEPVSLPPSNDKPDALRDAGPDVAKELQQIKAAMTEMSATAQRSSTEVREMHRLYHNEFAGRLRSMQEELDQYHNSDRGKAFDDILGAIARIYGSNESLVDEIEDPKTRKHVQYMLFDLSDLLEEYGVLKIKSNVGDRRNTRHCQIGERIPTGDPALHDTIVVSHNTGFYKENRTIVKELVDVYYFDQTIHDSENPSISQQKDETYS